MILNYSKSCKVIFGKPNEVVRRSQFRTKYLGKQIRLLAFWDKTEINETLVLATHGFIKKVDKVPANEIERAKAIRTKYFENKPKI